MTKERMVGNFIARINGRGKLNTVQAPAAETMPPAPIPVQESAVAPDTVGRIFFTRGNDWIEPQQYYTRSFEAESTQAISRAYRQYGDDLLARAMPASATAYACAEYRGTTSAEVARYFYVTLRTDRVDQTPLSFFLKQSPYLINMMVISLLTWGRCYLKKLRNADGYPTGLQFLYPQEVQEVELNGYVHSYRVREPGWRWEEYDPRNIIYMQMFDPNPDGRGLSKLEVAFRKIGIELGLATYAAAFFVNSARPDGLLKLPENLTPEQVEEARQEWRAFKGSNNAHRTAVMPPGTEWMAMQTTPKDLMMRDLSTTQREDIAAIYNVDLSLLGLAGTSDPLSAQSTFGSKEVAHLRSVTLPFLRTIIFPALQEQWIDTDFRTKGMRLEIDDGRIPALAEANLARAQTAIQIASGNIADYNEARELIGRENRDGYLTRPAAEALAVWQQGGVTLNQLRELIGAGDTFGENGEVVFIGGTVVPVTRLMEWANANVENAKQPPTSFGGLSAPTPPDAPPAGSVERDADMDEDDEDDTSFWVAIPFANHPDLISAQRGVKTFCSDLRVEWVPPSEYHVTLIYVPQATPEQVTAALAQIQQLPLPTFDVHVGSLNYFDTPGGYALHFRVRGQAESLRMYQRRLYDICRACGMALSSYSDPLNYKPHITMGYSVDKPSRWKWKSTWTLKASALVANHGDECVIEPAVVPPSVPTAAAPAAPALTAPVDPVDPVVVTPVVRAGGAIAFDLPFVDHALVLAAQRDLATWLTEWGVTDVEWTRAEAWCLPVATLKQATPATAARVMRECDYTDTRKIDLMSAGYAQEGNAVYLAVPATTAFNTLAESCALELSAFGRGERVHTPGILLGTIQTNAPTLDFASAPTAAYPLVGGTMTVRYNDQLKQVWELRGYTPSQDKELSAWRKVARNDIKRASTFRTDVLPHIVAAYVQLSLEDEEVDLDDLFKHAARWLVRAFPATRAAFLEEMLGIIGRAQKDEVSRAKFGGQVRSIVRRYGLQAMNDGKREVGADTESLTAKQLAAFRAWQAEQSTYVRNFGEEIFKVGISERAVRIRAEMWANMTLESARELGLRFGSKEQRFIWVMGPTKEKCKDCVRLTGQIHTMAEWISSGYTPTSRKTKCRSFNCLCKLVPTEAPTRGDF